MTGTGTRTIRVATDVGGTFTDLVHFETDAETGRQTVRTAKVDTTPRTLKKVCSTSWPKRTSTPPI
jgi:N-methylhydantoinase A/oxoprolinase/acetone carboxylase beta subunit